VINKAGTEEDLLRSARAAFAAGWTRLKLYFMIGLPTETEEDVSAIIDLCKRVRQTGLSVSRRVNITCSVAAFIPKPHTPFQWERQISAVEAGEKIEILKRGLRKVKVHLRWHEPGLGALEGVLSRGGRRLLDVIIAANEKGARFDSWSEHHRSGTWAEAFRQAGLEPGDYASERDTAEPLPWGHLSPGIDGDFLLSEREKAYRAEFTADCRIEGCMRCGSCDLDEGEKPIEYLRAVEPIIARQRKPRRYRDVVFRYRMTYTKTGRAAFLGHLELKRILERAFRRAELPLRYSSGFNPEPRISYSSPVPLGVESTAELLDLDLVEPVEAEKLIERTNAQLPEGVVIYNARLISPKAPSITASVSRIKWRFDPASSGRSFAKEELERRITDFLSADEIPFTKVRKRKIRKVNMREFVDSIELRDDGRIELAMNVLRELQIRAAQVAQVLLGLTSGELQELRVKKVRNIFLKR